MVAITTMIQNVKQQAYALRNKGQNAEAILLFQQYLRAYPDDLITHHNLAAALGDVGKHKDSASVIGHAIEKGLNEPASWLVYARALFGLQEFEKSELAYRKLLELEETNFTAHKELTQLIWMRTGSIRNALKSIDKVLSTKRSNIELRVLRAELTGQMGDKQSQFDLMQECFKLSNQNPELHYFYSKAALAVNQLSVALKHATLAVNLYPTNLDIQIHYLNCLLANSEHHKALTSVESCLSRAPLNQYFLALKSTCFRLLGDDRYQQMYDYENLAMQLKIGVPKGWTSLSEYLSDLEAELDRTHKFKEHPLFLSVRHGSQISSITKDNEPAKRAFIEALEEPIQTYLDRLSTTSNYLDKRNTGAAELLSTWSVKLFQQGYHVNHVHQEGWLSSACHIRLNETGAKNEPKNAGWLKLGEPGCITEPSLKADHHIQPRVGHIIIFPSFMWHGTVPFSGQTSRLTVASDFVPK